MRVLLVEDDARVAAALRDVLGRHGFAVRVVGTAAAVLPALDDGVDVVVLDVGLPDGDGFEVCSRIRAVRDVPVIMATARGDLPSRVHGLHLGADDYLVKPYDLRELMARIHAVTRRSRPAAPAAAPPVPGAGPSRLVVDPLARTVTVDGRPVALSRKEFDVLAVLARTPGVVVRREQILSEVWRTRGPGGGRTLEVHVAAVRAKLGLPGAVVTVRGVGYRLGEV